MLLAIAASALRGSAGCRRFPAPSSGISCYPQRKERPFLVRFWTFLCDQSENGHQPFALRFCSSESKRGDGSQGEGSGSSKANESDAETVPLPEEVPTEGKAKDATEGKAKDSAEGKSGGSGGKGDEDGGKTKLPGILKRFLLKKDAKENTAPPVAAVEPDKKTDAIVPTVARYEKVREVHSASVPTCYVRNVQDVDETLQESSCGKIPDMSEGNCISKDHEDAFQEVDSESDDDDEESRTAEERLKGEVDDLLKLPEKEKEKIGRLMADRLLHAALDESDEEEDGDVPEHKQRSLRVGILGAANAGKSSITNLMVGTKVAAVSRKRNTTLSEILGVMTKAETQILFYDTPGLVLDILGKPSKTDTRRRSESAWQLFAHCEVLVVVVDAYRQIQKPDKRVIRLVERLGLEENPHPKRILCLNKVDIVQKKKDLLPLAQLFEKLPGYESIFMISALTGSGVKELENYLINQAVLRPWEEESNPLNEEAVKTLSMEIVREHLLHHVHEEIPYELDHQLTDWQELEDGSLRIEQHFYLPKKGQCRILVGKGGSKIREIGIRACEELRQLLGRKVHLYLEVKHT